MSRILAVVLLFGVVCSASTVHLGHLQKRHLTPIGSVIRETASKLLNPLGIVRNAGSQSSSQSQSFSIGGSLLGLSGSLSAASSNANSFGGNSAASSSAGSSAGGSSSQAQSSSASQEGGFGGFGNFGGVSNSQAQSSASSSNVGGAYVQPVHTNLEEMFAHNSNFQAQPVLNPQSASFVPQTGSLGNGYNAGYVGGHKNIHAGVPITGNGEGEVIGFEVKPIIAVRPPVNVGVGQGGGVGFSNSYSNSQAAGFGGGYGGQKGTVFPAHTLPKPDATIIAIVEDDSFTNKKKNYPHYNNYHSTNYGFGNLERPGGVWENTKFFEGGNHGITGTVPVSHGVYGGGSQSASFSQANAQNFQGVKGTDIGGYGSNGNVGLGGTLMCGHPCSRPGNGGSGYGSSGGFSNAQSQSQAFKGNSNIETVDSAIGEVFGNKQVFGNVGGGSGSHSSSQSNSQSSNYGGFSKSGSQSSSSSQSHGGSSSSSSQASSYSKSDSLIFY